MLLYRSSLDFAYSVLLLSCWTNAINLCDHWFEAKPPKTKTQKSLLATRIRGLSLGVCILNAN